MTAARSKNMNRKISNLWKSKFTEFIGKSIFLEILFQRCNIKRINRSLRSRPHNNHIRVPISANQGQAPTSNLCYTNWICVHFSNRVTPLFANNVNTRIVKKHNSCIPKSWHITGCTAKGDQTTPKSQYANRLLWTPSKQLWTPFTNLPTKNTLNFEWKTLKMLMWFPLENMD